MRSGSAIDRVARILDLLPLLSKRAMSITELETLTGVDAQVISHDLEIAFLCGLPGYTPDLLIDIDFDEENVSVIDAQVLDQPRQLTSDEASLLLVGLEIIETWFHQSVSIKKAVASLKEKVSGEVSEVSDLATMRGSGSFTIIEQAIIEERDLSFNYIDTLGRSTSDRQVSPIRLRMIRGQSLLEAFDRSHSQVRLFFVEAISECRIGDKQSDSLPKIKVENSAPRKAKVKMRYVPRWWLRRHANFIVHSQEVDTAIELEIEYWSNEWLMRAILPIADHLISFTSRDTSESAFRQLLLSHFSGSSAPVEG